MGGAYLDQAKRRATWRRYHCRNRVQLCERRRNNYEVNVWPRHLMLNYNLTVEQYNSLLVSQGGLCAITGLPPNGGEKLQVDHCHKTNVVRGLIRKEINKALGVFQDNPVWLRNAATYLEVHPSM